MNKRFPLAEMLPIIKETLSRNKDVKFTTSGISMLPMLRDRKDQVVLSPIPSNGLKKYDLPLYRREDGTFVLHRIIKKKGNTLVMRGDNQFFKEAGIKLDQCIGVVTAFTRKGKDYSCNQLKYRLYCLIWVNSCPFRYKLLQIKRVLSRLKNKIMK